MIKEGYEIDRLTGDSKQRQSENQHEVKSNQLHPSSKLTINKQIFNDNETMKISFLVSIIR